MASHGGARSRSGPAPQEGSATSDRRGYVLTALPAEGYTGPIPDFPLPHPLDRELELWQWLWRLPQACAWVMPSEAWRLHDIAHYARLSMLCETLDATASDRGQRLRLADAIGLSTRGLADMGWKVAVDEVAVKRGHRAAAKKPAKPPVRRLRPPADAAPAG